MSNSTASRYTSTLLIPENVVFVPYALLVLTVIGWLGYDFFRFHQRNKAKFARMEEHMSIRRRTPDKQRISMVSGIGLRFRRGKPVLGDVWNTSPSSSDVSSCYSPSRRRARQVCYSREITPSDDGGEGYSEGDIYGQSNTGSLTELGEDDDSTKPLSKSWILGGEVMQGDVNTVSERNSQGSHGFILEDNQEREEQCSDFDVTSRSMASPRPGNGGKTQLPVNRQDSVASATVGAGGGVDDGGGGGRNQDVEKVDVGTQTTFNSSYDRSPGPVISFPHPAANAHLVHVSPRHSIASEASFHKRRSVAVDPSDKHLVIDFSRLGSPRDDRSSDSPSHPSTPKHSSRRIPALRLDLLASPQSPVTEIVAKDHGFEVEGLEIPSFPGKGSKTSIQSSGSEVFKSPERRPVSHSFMRMGPSPSPAVTSQSPRPVSPRRIPSPDSPKYIPPHHSHHYNAQGRYDALSALTPESKSARPSSARKTQAKAQKSLSLPRSSRAASSSPRLVKHKDKTKESFKSKSPREPQPDPPQTAPIPTHMYHQDEEGFFSSVASHNPNKAFTQDGGDNSKKGILFFSRLAGAGRHNEEPRMGGGRRHEGGGYKTGGFES